jgi:hypothetical protein
MKVFLLTIYIYDVSSYKLEEVETSVHSSIESAELEWKKFIYEVYLDNNDFVEFEDFKVEDADFENYGMTIEEKEIK